MDTLKCLIHEHLVHIWRNFACESTVKHLEMPRIKRSSYATLRAGKSHARQLWTKESSLRSPKSRGFSEAWRYIRGASDDTTPDAKARNCEDLGLRISFKREYFKPMSLKNEARCCSLKAITWPSNMVRLTSSYAWIHIKSQSTGKKGLRLRTKEKPFLKWLEKWAPEYIKWRSHHA